jgi:GGDEF domain-containing protein
VAVGVVSCPQHATDVDELLELADSAMYRAKAAGESVAVGAEDVATEDPETG